MKIGIHQHVFTKNLFDRNLDLLNVIRDYGFESMDVNVRVLDLPGATLIRKRAKSLGLHLMGGGSLPADKELLSSDREKQSGPRSTAASSTLPSASSREKRQPKKSSSAPPAGSVRSPGTHWVSGSPWGSNRVSANDRGTPGSGQVRWDDVFRGLKDIGYDGTVTIEGFVDATTDVAAGACIWRKFAAGAEEMATEGLTFTGREGCARHGYRPRYRQGHSDDARRGRCGCRRVLPAGAQIDETARLIEKVGRRALPLELDVANERQVNEGVERVVSTFGRVDILCSNAGIFLTKPIAARPDKQIPGADLAESDANTPVQLADWRKVLDTNLTAAFFFARAVGPHLMKQKKGKVVITSSTAGDEGQNFLSAYCVSKAGLNSLTRCLASPASDYISGQVFTIDGGARGRGTGI